MIDYLVNNIRLLQILTIISATITIFLEIYFIVKNIKKKYEKFIYTECKTLKEDTVINKIPDEIVIKNDINQENIAKSISDIYDYKNCIIMQRDFEKKIQNTLIEVKEGYTRKNLEFFFNEKIFLMDIPNQRAVDNDLFKQISCYFAVHDPNLLGFIRKNKVIGKFDIDNIRNWNNHVLGVTGNSIIKSRFDQFCMYKKNYFRDDYVVEISKNLEEMQQFSKTIIIVGDSNKILLSNGELSSGLIRATDKCSGESYERAKNIIHNYSVCCTANAFQNNRIYKNELNSIIDSIEKDLDKLNQEQAEDLQDTLNMIVEEFSTGIPRVGRLKKCLILLAPMNIVSNSIPALAENLQKLCEYIMSFIN